MMSEERREWDRFAEDRVAADKRLDERFAGSDRFHESQLRAASTAARDVLKAEIARMEALINANEILAVQRSHANERALNLAVENSRQQSRMVLGIISLMIAAATVIITFVTLISTRHGSIL